MRPVLLATLTICTLPAFAGPVPAELRGTWSQDAGCAAEAMSVVFTAGAMEIRQDGEQRSLSEMDAKDGAAREIEMRATRIVYVRQPNAAPPMVGDILRFRRDGEMLRVLAVTMRGELVTLPPDSTVFHHCR